MLVYVWQMFKTDTEKSLGVGHPCVSLVIAKVIAEQDFFKLI